MFLEDLIPNQTKERMRLIEEAVDWSFSNLVRLSGLQPNLDFQYLDLRGLDLRGEDLRGFNFTGSDLRGCLKDAGTIIDSSTIFESAKLEWIDVQEQTIVQLMGDIEAARSMPERRQKLESLKSNFRSPNHIRIYLRNLIETTRSIEAFFDYLDFFDPETVDDSMAVAAGLNRFSTASVRKPGRSKRYLSPSTISYRNLLERISESDNPIARDAFNRYLERLSALGRNTRASASYQTEDDFRLLLASIDEAGGQGVLEL